MANIENSIQASVPLLHEKSSFYHPDNRRYGLQNQIKDIDLSGLEEDLDEIYVIFISNNIYHFRL